jgi:hypothetical protein
MKLTIWFWTTISQESPWLTCVQVICHTTLESYRWGLQLYFRRHLNQSFEQEVMAPQSHRNPNFESFGTPNLGVPGQNAIWVQALWLGIENIIRGKVVASPKSGSWWILWVRVCTWFVHAPKVLQLHIDQLLFSLCKSMWIIDMFVTHLNPHLGAPTHPFISEVLQARECAPTPYPSIIFTFGLALEFI